MVVFTDRTDAGQRLARRLEFLRGRDIVILALPRGGVPVGYEVALALDAPLDVIVVRKVGVPYHPELAMGAIGEGGFRVLNDRVLDVAQVTSEEYQQVEQRERAVLDDRVASLRRGRDRIPLAGRTAVIVDDGIATGSTARVACQVARHLGAAHVVLAVPVCAAQTVDTLTEADQVISVTEPTSLLAVGEFYRDFRATSDEEVVRLLDAARSRSRAATGSTPPSDLDLEVQIPLTHRSADTPSTGPPPDATLSMGGHLHVPASARGIVVFAHGSGSSRFSPRNRFVAEHLHRAGLGSLLLDLLTLDEEADRSNVFDIELLARRLALATTWLGERDDTAGCEIGYFGASTGAGAALRAAAEAGPKIAAIVSRGGRPDLAGSALARVTAPTLLIVGGADPVVLDLNRAAQAQLRCENDLVIVEGATHLFEEPGTLAQVAELASDWFVRHLRPRGAEPPGAAHD